MKQTITRFAILLLISKSILAWHDAPHIITARIAETVLLQEAPDIYQKAVDIITQFSQWAGEGKYPFIECSTWQDRIRADFVDEMSDWDYVNNIISLDGTVADLQTQLDNYNTHNATKQISNILKTISIKDNHHTFANIDNTMMKSIMMRTLIHLVADIHQPLHAATALSKRHPTGDQMGNLYQVQFKGQRNRQHFVWDAAFEQFEHGPDFDTKFDENQKNMADKFAQEIMDQFPQKGQEESGSEIKNDPQGWANEGLDIAGQNVYDGLVEGEALSDDYISQSKILCRKRIALAGYRLAFVLKEALANQKRLLIKNEDN